MFVVGLDPGFANLGYAVVEVTKASAKLVRVGTFQTAKSDKKRKVLATDDNLRRLQEIHRFLAGLIADYDVSVVFAESMSFPRNASAAAKVAMTWGVIASQLESRHLPIVQASPQEIKIAVCGVKSASKEQVAEAIERLYPAELHLKGLAKGLHEHAYDAIAAVHAGLSSELVKALRTVSA